MVANVEPGEKFLVLEAMNRVERASLSLLFILFLAITVS